MSSHHLFPFSAFPPLPQGASLYLLMDMREVEPSPSALRCLGVEPIADELVDPCESLLNAIRRAGGRIFLPRAAAAS